MSSERQSDECFSDTRRHLRRTGGVLLIALVMALASVSTASASGLQAVIAQIGSTTPTAYTVTITNEGEKTEGNVLIAFGGESHAAVSGVVPSTCTYDQPVAGTIGCPALNGGATLQLCYIGPQAAGGQIFGGKGETFALAPTFAVSSCPVPGFTAPTGSTGTGGGGNSGGGGGSTGAKPLALGKVTDNTKKGTASLSVTVPGPGSLKLSGQGVKGKTANPKAAGAVTLPVKATGDSAKTLARSGKVTLHVSVTFTPSGGKPTTLKKKVKLIKG